jgi:hypothetical protein
MWVVELRGGAYDGFGGKCLQAPPAIVVAFRHTDAICSGHIAFDASHPGIVLRTAESYWRVEFDEDRLLAVYEVGDSSPGPCVEEFETVGAGGDLVPA